MMMMNKQHDVSPVNMKLDQHIVWSICLRAVPLLVVVPVVVETCLSFIFHVSLKIIKRNAFAVLANSFAMAGVGSRGRGSKVKGKVCKVLSHSLRVFAYH